jgi:hypothetical protein
MGALDRLVTRLAPYYPVIVLAVLLGFFMVLKELLGPTLSLAQESAAARRSLVNLALVDAAELPSLASPPPCESPAALGDAVTFHATVRRIPLEADKEPELHLSTRALDAEGPISLKLLSTFLSLYRSVACREALVFRRLSPLLISHSLSLVVHPVPIPPAATVAAPSGDLTPAYTRLLLGLCPGAAPRTATFSASARLTLPPADAAPLPVSVTVELLTVTPRTAADESAEAAAAWAAASPVGRVMIFVRSVNPLYYLAIFIAVRVYRSWHAATARARRKAAAAPRAQAPK